MDKVLKQDNHFDPSNFCLTDSRGCLGLKTECFLTKPTKSKSF